MTEREKLSKPPIDAVYLQAKPDEPIELGQVSVQFMQDGTIFERNGAARMRFEPRDRLEFVCPLESLGQLSKLKLFMGTTGAADLTLKDRSVSFGAILSSMGDDGMVFTPCRSPVTVTPPSGALSHATFHLFNFPNFFGPDDYILMTGEPPLQGAQVCGRAVLNGAGWNVNIAANEQTGHLEKMLKAKGGYVITHVGRIVREDGSTFTGEQLENLLGCLQYFLSFALGRWAGVALPVGFDADGTRVFEQWGLGHTADGLWSGGLSWFDDHHGDLLSQVFPGFMSLWEGQLWHTPLVHALYWYIGANDRRVGIGVDTGLILAQTALELLAWNHCVMERKMVSPGAFKPRGLAAADKLRLLATSLDIPKEIPPHLPALAGKRNPAWSDGMEALTAVRNTLVHPDGPAVAQESYAEAWKLALWYIELGLLRLCGHAGKYANRLVQRWAGQTENVPWVAKGPYGP